MDENGGGFGLGVVELLAAWYLHRKAKRTKARVTPTPERPAYRTPMWVKVAVLVVLALAFANVAFGAARANADAGLGTTVRSRPASAGPPGPTGRPCRCQSTRPWQAIPTARIVCHHRA